MGLLADRLAEYHAAEDDTVVYTHTPEYHPIAFPTRFPPSSYLADAAFDLREAIDLLISSRVNLKEAGLQDYGDRGGLLNDIQQVITKVDDIVDAVQTRLA